MKKLIEKLLEHDPDAAEYIQTDAQKLPSYDPTPDEEHGIRLHGLFNWRESEQGRSYWVCLAAAVGEYR